MTDLRQSSDYARYLKACNWQVAGGSGAYAFIRRIPFTPISIIKVQRPAKISFTAISRLTKKHRAFFVYLEPAANAQATAAQSHGFRLSKSPFLPTKTIHLDLSPPLAKILAQMKKDGRYCLRKAQLQTLQLTKVTNLTAFRAVWPRRWLGWKPSLKNLHRLKKSFGKNALFLAATSPHHQIIAGTVILIANKTAYYYYAFTTKQGRQKLAQYWLVWQAIKELKKRGCQIFDFEGIYGTRFSSKSWLGFSHFKHSFGGTEITYPGCFVKSRLRKVIGICTTRRVG